MKQTAVEWLSKQIKTSKYIYKLMADINSRSTIAQSDIIEQAKEMEKQQILRAYDIGSNEGYDLAKIDEIEEGHYMKEPIEYYNETFKQQENETNSI